MNTYQRIAKNAAVLYTSHIINELLAFVLVISITRILGDIILGKYSFAVSLTAILAVFISLGFDTLISRDVARDKTIAPKYLFNIAIIKAISSTVLFGLMILYINLMHYPTDTINVVLIFGFYFVFTAFANIFRVTFRAFERMEYEALVLTACRVVNVTLGLAALFLGYGLIHIAYAFLISGVLDLSLGFFICERKFVRLQFSVDFGFWKKATRAALPIALISITAIIYGRTDTVMLSAMKGDAEVGWYNAAYNLVRSLQPIPLIFGTAVLPVMSRLYISSKSSLQQAYVKSFYYLFFIGLPLTVGTVLLSDPIIRFLYGAEFVHSVVALQILAWNILLTFINSILARVLVSIDRQNIMAVVGVTTAVLNVILNLILIPRLGYIGAGIATIISVTVLFGLHFYFTSRYLYRLPLLKIIAKPIIACAVMAAFVYFGSGLHLAVIIITAVVIYFVVFFLIKGFTKEDWEIIAGVISRRRG